MTTPNVRVVERTARILQAIRADGALNVSEVSRRTGVPYATSYRIVQTLTTEGILAKLEADGRWRLTLG